VTGVATQDPLRRRTIYLVRHAIAAERGEKYPDDTVRPLTRDGIARMRKASGGFATLDPKVEVILSSPLVRARRTAEILATVLGPDIAVEMCDELSPGQSPAGVARALTAHASRHVVALVGHEPDLGELAAWLIGAREPLQFKKGGIARIDVANFPPGRNGQLVWLATPRMLRALG
jgi:phosphohistidine phosphatase